MRKCVIPLTLIVLATSAAYAPAAGRFRTAVLPAAIVPKDLPQAFHPGEYVVNQMVIGLNKVSRFDVLLAGDVDRLLEEHLIEPADVKVTDAAKIAKALKARLLLFPKIHVLSVEIETEDRVLVQTKTAVCTVTLGGTLYDATTGKTKDLGPYTAEDRKVGARDQRGRVTITDAVTEKMLKRALDAAAKRVRSRIYKLHPLAGKIAAGDGKTVTIDIGSAMGVKVKQKYTVTTLVTRENEITGLMEKVPEEVSVLVVVSVSTDSATCRVVSGEKTPLVGSTVKRKLK